MSIDWQADPEEVSEATSLLRFALRRRAAAPGDVGALAGVLRAAGKLVALEAPHAAAQLLPRGLVQLAALSAVLDREEMEEALEVGAARLVERLREHEASGATPDDPSLSEGHGVLEREATGLLRARDDAELEVLGAAAALGCPPEEVESRSTVRLVFDQVVRPELWRLVELNEARQAALAHIAPRLRPRFWWWHAGSGIHPDAVSRMTHVAHLLAVFPDARARLEALVRAQAAWAARPLPSPASAKPDARSLRRWLARRTAPAGSDRDTALLSLAAAPHDEHTVLETDDVQVSFCPPRSLILDLLSDLRPGAQPAALLPSGGELASEAEPDAELRFVLDLPDGALDIREIAVRLPLTGGDVELILPPRDGA